MRDETKIMTGSREHLEGEYRADVGVAYEVAEEKARAYVAEIEERCHGRPGRVKGDKAGPGLEYEEGEYELEAQAPADKPPVDMLSFSTQGKADGKKYDEPSYGYQLFQQAAFTPRLS